MPAKDRARATPSASHKESRHTMAKKVRRTAAPKKGKRSTSSPRANSTPAKSVDPKKSGTKKRPTKDGAKSYTSEENRGGHFFTKIRVWRILHEDQGRTLFNKQMLAERFFESIEDDEDPDPEQLDNPLENDPDADWLADDDSFDLSDEQDASLASGASGKLAKPYNRIRERHKRRMQRAVEALQNYGVEIDDTDERGRVLSEKERKARQKNSKSAERWWRYNPNGHWAQEFQGLLTVYGINPTELVAMMALRDLLEDMRGTPHQKSMQNLLDNMMACVPPEFRREAIEQSRSYRHSVGNTAKYIPKAELLQRWYEACMQRRQVTIRYTVPGKKVQERHLAALSTVFNREENSLYLLGSEKTSSGWGKVKQWKMDRVTAVEETGINNPSLAALAAHPLVRPAPGGEGIERLDANWVFDYSAGAWLELAAEPKRLEIIVRVPRVGRPGMAPDELAKLQNAAHRRAHNWMAWCREKPLHPRQHSRMEPAPDGDQQLRLVVERCYVTEMASRLLRLQDCFEVVEPPELAVLIRQYAAAIAAAHGA
jgi:predicted DNA-binding transcriptional regulator YafY